MCLRVSCAAATCGASFVGPAGSLALKKTAQTSRLPGAVCRFPVVHSVFPSLWTLSIPFRLSKETTGTRMRLWRQKRKSGNTTTENQARRSSTTACGAQTSRQRSRDCCSDCHYHRHNAASYAVRVLEPLPPYVQMCHANGACALSLALSLEYFS